MASNTINDYHIRRIQWYYSGPSGVTSYKGMGLQFVETAYISEVNTARNIISDTQVATNKNLDLVQKVFH